MNRRYMKPLTSTALALIAIILVLSAGGTGVNAQEREEATPSFGLAPVNIEGGYFDLTLSPGDTHQIQVEIRNSGAADGDALVYLADVATRVNGGMAVGLAGEPVNDAARWIDFTEETIPVRAESALTRTLTISVPDDAAAGEHLTSIVVQEADKTQAESPSGVMLNTVSRQAVGILITVPGAVNPALEIGVAGHTNVAGRSVVTFEATNPGNLRVTTAGEFTVANDAGEEIYRAPVAYKAVYAGTGTTLEAPLDVMLAPGDYTVSLSLDDSERGVHAESGALALNVPVPEEPVTAAPQDPAADEEMAGDEAEQTVITAESTGVPTWVLLVAIPIATVAAVVATVMVMRRRMSPATATPAASIVPQQVVTRETSPQTPAKPATVRKLTPPSRTKEHE